jgi:hypothetical protein
MIALVYYSPDLGNTEDTFLTTTIIENATHGQWDYYLPL